MYIPVFMYRYVCRPVCMYQYVLPVMYSMSASMYVPACITDTYVSLYVCTSMYYWYVCKPVCMYQYVLLVCM